MVAEGWDEVPVGDDSEDLELTDAEYASLDPVEKAREDLRISDDVDPLTALLRAEDKEDITDVFRIPRLGVSFVVRPIADDREYDKLVERCTILQKRRGGSRYRELDGRRLARLIVAAYTVTPPFNAQVDEAGFQKMVARFGTEEPESLVAKALLPGEIDALSDHILTLSGFSDEVAGVDTAGN